MHSHKIRRAVVLIAAFLGAARMGSAMPIQPVPLWDLTGEAEVIVLARVERVAFHMAPPEPADDRSLPADVVQSSSFDGSAVAHLRVLETWKGAPAPTLEVAFDAGWMCPAPPRYTEGETVLAFLVRGDAALASIDDLEAREKARVRMADRWLTVGLSHGALYLGPDELSVFRARVSEAVTLRAAGPVKDGDLRAWLVRAAVEPATRWHGLSGLSEHLELSSAFDPRTIRNTPWELTPAERRRLAAAFVRDPVLDHVTYVTLLLLADVRSRDVDRAALTAIEAGLASRGELSWIHWPMQLTLARFSDTSCLLCDDPRLKELHLHPDALREAWAAERERLGLPKVAPRTTPAARR